MDRSMLGRALMGLGALLVVAGVVGVLRSDDDPAEAATPNPAATTGSAASTGSTATTSSTTSTTTTSTTTTTTAAPLVAETPQEFLAVLLGAFAGGDDTTLFDRMNQATLDRYGEAQCQTYAASIAGQPQELTFREAAAAASWDYTTDEVTTTLDDVVAVEVERTVNGETIIQELHWQLVDGQFTWLTDCGEPV